MNSKELLQAANALDSLYSHSSIFSILQLPFSHSESESTKDQGFSLLHIESELFKNSYSSFMDFQNKLTFMIGRWIAKPLQETEVGLFRVDKIKEHQREILKKANILICQSFERNLHGLKIHELQKPFSEFTWSKKSLRWVLKIQLVHNSYSFTPRDTILYEGLHAPLYSAAKALCPGVNSTAIIPLTHARLAFRVYIMKNRGVLDDCIISEAGLVYTLVKHKEDSYIVVLRPVSRRQDFIENDFEGDCRSPKSWVWTLLVGVLHLENPKALRKFNRSLFSLTPELIKKPNKTQKENLTVFLNYLSNHFVNAFNQTTANIISRFTHAPLVLADEEPDDWSRVSPVLTFDSAVPLTSLPPSCIVFFDEASTSNPVLPSSTRGSSSTESLYATPSEQDTRALISISSPTPIPQKREPIAQAPQEPPPVNNVSPPYSDESPSDEDIPKVKIDRVSWFKAKASTLFPILVNALKTPQYPTREYLRPNSLNETKSVIATAASVPSQRIFSEYVIMRALLADSRSLDSETIENLTNMGTPIMDGHFKVIFAHPNPKLRDICVVSLFKCIEPSNLPARLNELALLVKFKGIKGFSQINSIVLDSQRQIIGFVLKRHAATFKEVLHRGNLAPQIKLGLTYRLARVLRDLHNRNVAHRDLSEVNLMVDINLFEEIKGSITTFNRPRKSQKTSETSKAIKLEGNLEDLISEDPIIIDFGKSALLSSQYTRVFKDVTGSLPPYVSAPEYLPKLRLDVPDEGFRLYRSIVTLPGPKRASPEECIFDGLKEDVYGFGIIMFRVITGTMPWGSIQESCIGRLREIVSNESEQKRFLLQDLPHSPFWRKLLLKTLHPDPDIRWSMAKVVAYFEAYPNALLAELNS
ncbi:hypothetical protein DSO57_1038193 [Entomophthora muscae]|uniref:Uncharacterized protein n=2 Tax=Entomophthora muscae TaxID=34485 RepID=A0ACC2SBX3_9FUNG|nr:hypothetical protein DSO57_1038193 [Entomophthora muscae]